MLKGQVAIVTGASRGIGECIARTLAQANAAVVGTSTSDKGAEGISKMLAEAGAKGAGRVLDVRDAAACSAFVEKVQEELSAKGYGLKIWDAYRPYSVTKKMWELIGDERYVANPAKGSGHNRGLAVDVTIVKDGKEINMGTGFDNFTDTAHHDFKNLPEDVLKNRMLLKTTMEKYGFKALETEWWHYSFPNDRNYAVLDLSFKQLSH